jgi:hypothetical protein
MQPAAARVVLPARAGMVRAAAPAGRLRVESQRRRRLWEREISLTYLSVIVTPKNAPSVVLSTKKPEDFR